MIEFFPTREIVIVIGEVTVRWYGLFYVLAFWLGWWLLPPLARLKKVELSRDDVSFLTLATVVGVVVGGRLGYVILYEPTYYLAHLPEIFSLGSGGMSAHGGFIGVALALAYVSKKLKVSMLVLADLLVIPVAWGLALGRVGNYINQELYAGSWAIVVAGADAALGFLCWYLLRRRNMKTGGVTGVFFIGYSLIRFFNEYVRIDDWLHGWGLTYGQILTVPMFVVGIYVWGYIKKSP